MNIVCSTCGILDTMRPQLGINAISGAGFKDIVLDFGMLCSCRELENLGKSIDNGLSRHEELVSEKPELLYKSFKIMNEYCASHNVAMNIAKAPYLLCNTVRYDLHDVLINLIEESIKVCGRFGIHSIIVLPYFAGVSSADEWKVNREYYLKLAKIAKENNVMILLKNLYRDNNGKMVRGICADPYEAVEWIDGLNEAVGEERFGFCMDVGVCNICGQDMREFAFVLADRIKAVILSDCDGREDNKMLPFSAISKGRHATDWLSLIRGLRAINFDGLLICDMSSTVAGMSHVLKPQVVKLAKSVADYFVWQIDLERTLGKYDRRVLFGAGNMCRNYMKHYGRQYPPLYTCDNNKKLWGSEFEGLIVKNPEELKKLPADCAIFICNMYYKEIEAQLKGMNLKNPIEFFDDEYLPACH